MILASAVSRGSSSPSVEAIDQLIRDAVAGDGRAFAELYQLHVDSAYRLLTRLVGPDQEREDLLQDIFLRLHRFLPGYRFDAQLSTFLHRIVVNVAYDHLKRRRRVDQQMDPEFLAASIDPGASPEKIASIAQTLSYLSRLSPPKRIALVLREVVGLSYDEIGSLVGARPSAVRQRVKHATRELSRMIDTEPREL